ncbi:flap endonuclease GEN 1 [Biomphalaria glabrata]|nr:flap endonuclease GEN-like protein 1-like [Biomphalaria glabrata]
MGITGLWSLLSPIKTNVCLTECEGKILAVDLSAWIVQLQTTSSSAAVSERYLCHRGIFFKTLKLLSLGISLIFVMDGPVPPQMKRNRKTRDFFYQSSLQYKELLLAMGLPVIESVGEAEKLCADLNRKKIVDGIITDDGDVFVYGGEIVYKGVFSKQKERFAEKYQMRDITSSLKLTHRDLVVYALMNHGDLTDGVPNVGEKTFIKLMEEFKNNQVEDALERIQLWKNSQELTNLETKKLELLNMKTKHCTRCQHEGSKQLHAKQGCLCCQTAETCVEVNKKADHNSYPLCSCQQHCLERHIFPYTTEMKIRSSALQSDPYFPNQEIIKEYLENENSFDDPKTQVFWPNFPKLFDILGTIIKLTPSEIMNHILPAYIKLALCGIVPMHYAVPLGILSSCTESTEKCFQVKWKISDLDEYIAVEDKCYVLSIPKHMFMQRYPDMAKTFTNPNELKRKHDPPANQRKISEFFKAKK